MSGWNEKTELQAYKIFRILLEEKFPRGLQINLCKELEKEQNSYLVEILVQKFLIINQLLE